MTRGPHRLKDDPDFKWETGCDVADESLLVGEYDLQGTRSRLLAAIALAGPASLAEGTAEIPQVTTVGDGIPAVRPGASSAGWSVLKPLAVAVTGALVVGASYWVGVQVGADSSAPELAPVETPSEPSEAPPVKSTSASAPVEPAVVAAAPGTPDVELVVSRPEVRSKSAPSKSVPSKGAPVESVEVAPAPPVSGEMMAAVAAAEQLEAAGTGEAPELPEAEPVSVVNLQNNAYSAANAALAEGDYERALELYDAYLARWPTTGAHKPEVHLGRLQAFFSMGDVASTESLARSLQDLPSLSGRRQEILRLRTESLVLLDRCEEALLLADEIPSKAAAEVRRVCRRSGKESP